MAYEKNSGVFSFQKIKDFNKVYTEGKRLKYKDFSCVYLSFSHDYSADFDSKIFPNTTASLAIVCSKKRVSPKAVERNLARRRLRAAIYDFCRLHQSQLLDSTKSRSIQIVIFPYKSACQQNFNKLKEDTSKMVKEIFKI